MFRQKLKRTFHRLSHEKVTAWGLFYILISNLILIILERVDECFTFDLPGHSPLKHGLKMYNALVLFPRSCFWHLFRIRQIRRFD